MNGEMIIRQGIDSKALLVTLICGLPRLLLLAAAGAVLGSGFYLAAALYASGNAMLVSETEYYIDFAQGRLEAKDYYNDYTWNDVIATDLILGRMMEELGEDYDREEVKQMLFADILSDVRYLTITVTGSDEASVSAVSAAFENAIAIFGGSMDEFDSIYKIEDNGIRKEHVELFSWRAAVLGAAVFAGIGIFFIALAFMVGDRFYTKTDVAKFLELPVCGLSYKDGVRADFRERRLLESLKELQGQSGAEKIYLLDAAGGQDADAFAKRLGALDADIARNVVSVCGSAVFEENALILAVVPFGRVYREKITDEINNAAARGRKVSGAALVQCDRRWMRLYYGKDVEK
ncbi:MAG: hypothetical protein LUE96_04565 [Lachnospiraceae bacterium]|nr:hypothetical protein [Lachnospiraceae bacterium]